MHTINKFNVSHLWTVACQSSSIDYEKNTLSLFDTIDELNVTLGKETDLKKALEEMKAKPALIPVSCQLISMWKKVDSKKETAFTARITYQDPQGFVLSTMDHEIRIPDGKMRTRYRINIPALQANQEGEYRFAIEIIDPSKKSTVPVTEVPIDILISKEA